LVALKAIYCKKDNNEKIFCNEEQEEHSPSFKKLKNKHSAFESNINELGHRGLDRCPDSGLPHFTRYIGLVLCAYNFKKMGRQILKLEREALIATAKEVRFFIL
jgi:hypothetical protein